MISLSALNGSTITISSHNAAQCGLTMHVAESSQKQTSSKQAATNDILLAAPSTPTAN
jgi:hypothetical protein